MNKRDTLWLVENFAKRNLEFVVGFSEQLKYLLSLPYVLKVPQQKYDNKFENLFLELLRDQNVRTLHLWIDYWGHNMHSSTICILHIM